MKKITTIILIGLTCATSFAQCSYVSGQLVNACGGSAEGINEMVTIKIGADSVNWNDISITFPSAGTYCNSCTKTWTTNSSYVSTFLESDCPSEDLIIEVGVDTDIIPPQATLIIFTGNPPSFDFDFSNLCGNGQYYVMFADNISTTGRFANSANADRTTTYDIDGCIGDATYFSSSANTGTDGDGVVFDSLGNASYVNSCDAIPIIVPEVEMNLDTTHFDFIFKPINENKSILMIHNMLGQELQGSKGFIIIRYEDGTTDKLHLPE